MIFWLVDIESIIIVIVKKEYIWEQDLLSPVSI